MAIGIGQKLKQIGKLTAAVVAAIMMPQVGRDDIADAIGYVENAGVPSAVVPDFIGQKLFDTSNSNFYVAYGVAAGNWAPMGVGTLTAAELAVLDGASNANDTTGKAAILGTSGALTVAAALTVAGGSFLRSTTGMNFIQQTAPTAKADADSSITAAQMINGIVVHTVTTGRALTTPTGAAISAGCPATLAVGDSFLLHVISVGTGADDISTLTAGDGNVTFSGKVTVGPDTAAIAAYGTWLFRNTGTSTWVGYRVG